MPVNFQKVSATNVIETTDKRFMTDAEKATIAGLGTASTYDVGTGAGDIPLLDAEGKLQGSVLPDFAITDVFVVASQTEMLELSTAKTGDVAIRTDLSKTFILSDNSYGTLASWKELSTPAAPVTSVAGKTGVVSLVVGDISGLQTALDNKLDDSQLSIATDLGGAGTSDSVIASQRATKIYVDTVIGSINTSLASTTENVVVSSSAVSVAHTIKGVVMIYSLDEGIVRADSYSYLNSAITFSDTSLNGKTVQVTYLF